MMFRNTTVACLLAASLALTGCAQHETLSIAGYVEGVLDSAIVAQFQEDYYSQTGKHVDITLHNCEEFELMTNAQAGRLYDLMITTNSTTPAFKHLGVLRPINHAHIRPLDDYLPYMVNFPSDLGNQYTVPYSYLMMGIVFDPSKTTRDEAGTIEALWNPKFKGRIGMQALDLVMYCTASAYVHLPRLAALSNGFTSFQQAYRDSLRLWLMDCSPSNRAAVKRALLDQRPLVGSYDVGSKLSAFIASGEGWIGWMRHPQAIAALFQNRHLEFCYSREGSIYCPFLFNMTTACKNTGVAYAFLRYISSNEVSVRNMYEHFMPGVAVEAVEQCREKIADDTARFAGTTPQWRENFFNMYNMPEDVAKRTPLQYAPDFEDLHALQETIKEFWREN